MKISESKEKNVKLVYILTLFYIIPLAIFFIANTIFSLLQTTYMELYQEVEKPLYKQDSPFLLLLAAACFAGVFIFIQRRKTISAGTCLVLEHISLIASVLFSLFIVLIYRANVACDSSALSDIAIDFLKGDYSSFTGDGYLVHYPHQLGMIVFLQIIYFLFGVENFIVLQLLNIIAICFVVYFLHRITEELFHNNMVQIILSVLCMALLPLFLYATFIYGDIPGMGFALPAIYYIIKYMHTNKRQLLLPAALCMALSILFKSNNSVILTAAVIILILHAVKEKNRFAIAFAAVLVISPLGANTLLDTYYIKTADIENMPEGVPKVGWIAMGLQENDYLENGWYNSYNWVIYTSNNYDAALTKKACMESISNSIHSFISHPKSAIRFFYRKFISQWNDPGFQSQLNTEWYSRHRDDHSPLALSLIYGKGRVLLEWLMNIYHFLILFGASVYVIRIRKNWSLSSAFLMLCIFGGYFFHMFWEACGRYGLGYFVLCLPLAACGFLEITHLLSRLIHTVKDRTNA